MSFSGGFFALFVAVSLALVAAFYWGVKKNISKAKNVASFLEDAFSPRDQTYTWLGGVIGFYAEYDVPGFKKVTATLRLVPRHSVLWLPFSLLAGRRDTLEVLFYLNCPVKDEFHIIRKGAYRPRILNKDLYCEDQESGGVLWRLCFSSKRPCGKLKRVVEPVEPMLLHAALTREKRVLYLRLRAGEPSRLSALKETTKRLKGVKGF